MITETLTTTITLEATTCGVCGVPFAMPDFRLKKCREKGEIFYCPNGHSLVYLESDVKRLQKEKSDLQEKWFAEQRAHEETQCLFDKLKKRVRNGVCPCCKRTFSNLHNHIKTKHPDYPKATK